MSRATAPSPSAAAAALSRRRWANRSVRKTCLHCGKSFLGDELQAYCKPSHQTAAAAKRYRARLRQARTTGAAPVAVE